MITGKIILGGVSLDDNLHLTGFETDPDVAYSVRDTIGGSAIVQVEPRSAGARLSLIAKNTGSAKMGQFCSSQITSLKAIANTTVTQTLTHPAVTGTINVKVLEFNIQQSDEREEPGPNKKWHGEIVIQEV